MEAFARFPRNIALRCHNQRASRFLFVHRGIPGKRRESACTGGNELRRASAENRGFIAEWFNPGHEPLAGDGTQAGEDRPWARLIDACRNRDQIGNLSA
jgi:hypothetical protein